MVNMEEETDGWKDGQIEGQIDDHLKIHPCVLQAIGPLGPLLKKLSSSLVWSQK